ncbi:MAG: hypothetical protein WC022_03180 [Parcubacteria group bacterium]
MKYLKEASLRGKMIIALSVLLLVAGFGLLGSRIASANNEDGRMVVIGGTEYDVMHDGEGPNIVVNGKTYYLNTEDNDNSVMVGNHSYLVQDDNDADD